MGIINISSNESGDKDIELTNLEAHVALSVQRHRALEKKIDELIEQGIDHKKIVMSAAITLVAGGLSGLTALIIFLADKVLK